MHNAAHLAAAAAGRPQPTAAEEDVTYLFQVMHGYYGNLFFSKFASGQAFPKDHPEKFQDTGIAGARKVWAHSLRDFHGSVIRVALQRCQRVHPEFPPSLPQFLALCEAARPVEVFRAPAAVEMSPELRASHAAAARERRQGHLAAARAAIAGTVSIGSTGLDALKLCIANAVAAAGGDEAAEMLRLDRMLAPAVAA